MAVGGSLLVCANTLVFAPHLVERALKAIGVAKGKAVEIPFAEIESVGKDEADMKFAEAFSGGWRDRLLIKLQDGTEELFVVNALDDLVEYIADRVGKAE